MDIEKAIWVCSLPYACERAVKSADNTRLFSSSVSLLHSVTLNTVVLALTRYPDDSHMLFMVRCLRVVFYQSGGV